MNKPFRLLVEGKNDQHVIWNLAERLKLKETFDVDAKDSYKQLIEALPTLLKSTNTLKRIGIIVDADENGGSHWNAIRTVLEKSGYYSSLPGTLPKEGFICHPDDEEQLIVGVWIMPDNRMNGMLEDFVAFMIPDYVDNPLLKKADEVLLELERNSMNAYKQAHHAKARIHTWLAWQDEPGTPMGTAITKQILSTESELCRVFIHWLELLFECKGEVKSEIE